MKKLLLVCLLALSACASVPEVSPRAAHLQAFETHMQAHLKELGVEKYSVTDTGDNLDLGAGEGPVVLLKLPTVGRECLLAVHPTDPDQMATLGCVEVEPVVEG